MSGVERMTVTMPADMAAVVRAAVDSGDYASTSEVVSNALRDWKIDIHFLIQIDDCF